MCMCLPTSLEVCFGYSQLVFLSYLGNIMSHWRLLINKAFIHIVWKLVAISEPEDVRGSCVWHYPAEIPGLVQTVMAKFPENSRNTKSWVWKPAQTQAMGKQILLMTRGDEKISASRHRCRGKCRTGERGILLSISQNNPTGNALEGSRNFVIGSQAGDEALFIRKQRPSHKKRLK